MEYILRLIRKRRFMTISCKRRFLNMDMHENEFGTVVPSYLRQHVRDPPQSPLGQCGLTFRKIMTCRSQKHDDMHGVASDIGRGGPSENANLITNPMGIAGTHLKQFLPFFHASTGSWQLADLAVSDITGKKIGQRIFPLTGLVSRTHPSPGDITGKM